jgi:hypothetical protein
MLFAPTGLEGPACRRAGRRNTFKSGTLRDGDAGHCTPRSANSNAIYADLKRRHPEVSPHQRVPAAVARCSAPAGGPVDRRRASLRTTRRGRRRSYRRPEALALQTREGSDELESGTGGRGLRPARRSAEGLIVTVSCRCSRVSRTSKSSNQGHPPPGRACR